MDSKASNNLLKCDLLVVQTTLSLVFLANIIDEKMMYFQTSYGLPPSPL